MGSSFEAEVMGAAGARSAEKKYIAQHGGAESHDDQVLDTLSNPSLSLESPADERERIAGANARTLGQISDLQISEEDLRAQGVEAGVNPQPTRANEVNVTAREHFAEGPQDPLIESDVMTEARLKNPGVTERYASLKRDRVSRQADITNLEQQIVSQSDATIKAAQMRVLAQFQRELAALDKEIVELEKSL